MSSAVISADPISSIPSVDLSVCKVYCGKTADWTWVLFWTVSGVVGYVKVAARHTCDISTDGVDAVAVVGLPCAQEERGVIYTLGV